MSKHTKGPWLIRGDEVGYMSKDDDQSFGMFCPIAVVHDDANAHLISAAPEMLEVLLEIMDRDDDILHEFLCESEIIAARQAIAKAKGENNTVAGGDE